MSAPLDPLLHLRRRYPCEIIQDLTTNAVVISAVGSGKTRRIESPGDLPNTVKALRDAYEGMLAEIADDESKAAA